VNAPDLLLLLQDFYRDKQAMRLRHESGATGVSHYDFNNMYQYVIAREDVQLGWLRRAIGELGGTEPDVMAPDLPAGRSDSLLTLILEDDARRAQALVDRWRERVERITDARIRGMLRVILGETLEHKRFFDQALAGRTDLLGRRAEGAGTGGGVLATRWLE
jgi:hypothetical protein